MKDFSWTIFFVILGGLFVMTIPLRHIHSKAASATSLIVGTNAIHEPHATNIFTLQDREPVMWEMDTNTASYFSSLGTKPTNILKISWVGGNLVWITNALVLTNITLK